MYMCVCVRARMRVCEIVNISAKNIPMICEIASQVKIIIACTTCESLWGNIDEGGGHARAFQPLPVFWILGPWLLKIYAIPIYSYVT